MAFLCPSRLGKSKLKRGYNSMVRKLTEDRDVDSLELEDLVKLSYYTPEARRIILQNFSACESHEISVKQGQKVNFIYNEGDWAYIATDDKKQGFVPLNVCAKLGRPAADVTQVLRKKVMNTNNARTGRNPTARLSNDIMNNRKVSVESDCTASSHSEVADDSFSSGWSNDSEADGTSDVTMQQRGVSGVTMTGGQPMTYVRSTPFNESPMHFEAYGPRQPQSRGPITTGELEYFDNPPSPSGIYRVVYDYKGTDEYDVTVSADDIVCLLDSRDHDWFWVQLTDGRQGYVPSNYIAPIDMPKYKSTAENTYHTATTKQVNQLTKPTGNTACHHANANSNASAIVQVQTAKRVQEDVHHSKTMGQNDNPNVAAEQYLYSEVSKHRNNSRHRQDSTNDKERETRIYEEIDAIRKESKRQSRKCKKVPPKKPPRKKRPNQCTSPRSEDSLDSTLETTLDSIDTSVLDSDYSRSHVHSELDDLQPYGASAGRRHFEESVDDSEQSDVFTPRTDVYSPDSEVYSPRSETSDYTDAVSNTEYDSCSSQRYSQGHRYEEPSMRNNKRNHDNKQSHHGNVSVPVFRSFEENKRGGYFDQIFYDENDSRFGKERSSSPHSIVNVTEILKLRAKKEHDQERKRAQNKERAHRSNTNVPSIKEYLLPLPNKKQEVQRDKQKHKSTHNPGSDRSTNGPISKVSVQANRISTCQHDSTKTIPGGINTLRSTHKHERHYDSCSALNECNDIKTASDKKKFSSANNLKTQNNGENSNCMGDKQKRHYGSVNNINENKKIPENELRRSSHKQQRSSHELHGRSSSRNINESYKQGYEGERIRHRCGHFSSTNDIRESNSRHGDIRPRSNSHGTKHVQRGSSHIDSEKSNSDWSFGYPRKEKHVKSKSRAAKKAEVNHRTNASKSPKNKNTKDTTSQNGGEGENRQQARSESRRHNFRVNTQRNAENSNSEDDIATYSDDVKSENSEMREVLRQTDALLNHAGILLAHDSEVGDSDVFESDDDYDDDDDSKQFDGTVKCYNFLSNSTIGISGMGFKNSGEDLDDMILNGIGNPMNSDPSKSSNDIASNNTTADNKSGEQLDRKTKAELPNGQEASSLNLRLSLTDVRGITEFVAQCDYVPKENNELPMVHGEILHIGLDNQEKDGWYWAFSPRLRKNGYVSRAEVKIPLVTII